MILFNGEPVDFLPSAARSRAAEFIKLYLEYEEIPFEIVTDVPLLMKLSKGRLNPTNAIGFKVFPGKPLETIVTDVYEAINFVLNHGLRKI